MIDIKALELAWNKSIVGCATVHEDGSFRAVNARFCEIVEYTEAELSKLKFQDITLPADTVHDVEMARRVVAGEIDHYTMVKTYLKKSGFPVMVELAVWPIKQDDGTFDYFLAQIIPRLDITNWDQAKEINIDANVMMGRFLTQNKKLILGFLSATTGILTAVAIGIAKIVSMML